MVKLQMTDWLIPQSIPLINLGDSGENNAITVQIEIQEDEKFDFSDTKYYLDIMDKVDGEKTIARSQEMELIVETIDTETKYYLQMQPTSEWLGKSCLKYIQVRCEYTDNTDLTNLKEVVIKSNTINAIVKLGLV